MLAHFASCFEVDDECIAAALEPAQSLDDPTPRQKTLALLARMAEVSAPRQGAARALAVLAQVARCEWLDGVLETKIEAAGDGCVLRILVDDGMSATMLCAPLVFRAPMAEFRQLVDRRPEDVHPLVSLGGRPDEIRLRAVTTTEHESAAVASVVFRKESPAAPEVERMVTKKLLSMNIPKEAYRDDRARAPAEPEIFGATTARPTRAATEADEIDEDWG